MTITARLDDSGDGTSRSTDPKELEALYRIHGAAIGRLCLRRLGNEADADDACQEALVKAWRALDRFDCSREMWPWLATIAANACIDVQRRRSADSNGRVLHDVAPLQPDEVVIREDGSEFVMEVLSELPRPEQTVLLLRDVEGWSY